MLDTASELETPSSPIKDTPAASPKESRYSQIRAKVKAAWDRAREIKNAESTVKKGEGEQEWTVYGSGEKSYSETFKPILEHLDGGPYKDFNDYIDNRGKQGKGTFTVDFMGDGQFLRELPGIEGGIAVTLSDNRDDETKLKDASRNISVIEGDIQSLQTWMKISAALQAQGKTSGADLIVCRGVGGLNGIPEEMGEKLLDRAWGKVNRDKGLLLTQMPEGWDMSKEWNEALKISKQRVNYQWQRNPIMYREHAQPAIGLIKTDTSPKSISMKFLNKTDMQSEFLSPEQQIRELNRRLRDHYRDLWRRNEPNDPDERQRILDKEFADHSQLTGFPERDKRDLEQLLKNYAKASESRIKGSFIQWQQSNGSQEAAMHKLMRAERASIDQKLATKPSEAVPTPN